MPRAYNVRDYRGSPMAADEDLVTIPKEELDLLIRTVKYALDLEALVRDYYAEHQSAGCTCMRCEKAERALASIGHSGPSGSV